MNRHYLYILLFSLAFLTSCERISKELGLNVNSPETAPVNVLYGWVDDAPRGSSDRHMGVLDGYTITVRIGDPSKYSSGTGPSQKDTSTAIETVRLLGVRTVDRPDIYPFGGVLSIPDSSITAESNYDATWQDSTGARWYVFGKVWHKWVKLEFDTLMRDSKGRLLAYVYTDSSSGYSTFLNAELLRNGYGRLYINAPNYKYSTYFRQLQQGAQVNKTGIWAQ